MIPVKIALQHATAIDTLSTLAIENLANIRSCVTTFSADPSRTTTVLNISYRRRVVLSPFDSIFRMLTAPRIF
jgi:hypothetical protein